jgi:hypothetical protein
MKKSGADERRFHRLIGGCVNMNKDSIRGALLRCVLRRQVFGADK